MREGFGRNRGSAGRRAVRSGVGGGEEDEARRRRHIRPGSAPPGRLESGMNSSRSADVVLQGLSVLVEGQVDVRKPEGQPDQSHNQQSDGEQDQSWLQQQHRISDEPKQVSYSLNRPALDRVQRIRERERVEEEARIDQQEDRYSDENQGDLKQKRVD